MANAFADLPAEKPNAFADLPSKQTNAFADLPAEPSDGMIDTAIAYAKRDFLMAGKAVKHGYQTSAEDMYNLAANVPMLIHKASNYLAEMTGAEPSEDTPAKAVENWLRSAAQQVAPNPEDAPQSTMGKIYSGAGAAPGTIATYLPAVRGLGVVGGMAATEALGAADKGAEASLEAGVKGGLMGGVLKAAEPLSRVVRMPTMATVGGAQAAIEGGDVSDVVSGAAVMGGLGYMGAKEGLGVKDILPQKTARPISEQPAELPTEIPTETPTETVPVKKRKRVPKNKQPTEADYKAAEQRVGEFAGNINLNKIYASEDVKQLLKDTAAEHEYFMGARRGVVSHEATRQAAEDMGLTYDEFIKSKGRLVTESEALAGRMLLVRSADDVLALREKAVSGSDADVVAFQETLTRHVAIQEEVSARTAYAGRLLNQYKIQVASSKAKVDLIQSLIEQNGGRDKIEAVAEALTNAKNLADFNQLTTKMVRPKPVDMVTEAWINGLLSGPQTHAVNMTSNLAVALLDIPQTAIAATMGIGRKSNKVYFGEVAAKTFGFVEGSRIGLKRFLDTVVTGEPTDPLSKLEAAKYKAIPGRVGEVIRTPGRFLMAEDELFKAISYQMELSTQAFRAAKNEGLKGRDLAKRIEEYKLSPTEEMHDAAIAKQQYNTFTKPLGVTGKNVQKLAADNPALRFLMPFIRTPTNIVKYAGERTPFAVFSKNVRQELMKGGAARDEQLAKLVIGTMIGVTTASLVQQGKITGTGSSDPRQRAAEYAAGRPPSSILVNDTYYSYARIEPFGMLVGLTVDAAEIMDQMSAEEAEKIPGMLLASVSKNLTSKTYLKGLSETFKMLDDPDRYGDRWIQGYAGTVVPAIASQLSREVDPILRETQTTLDKIKSRIPYISETLTPRVTLWGDEIKLEGGLGLDIISPIYQTQKKDDKLLNEIVDLEIAPSMPKRKIFDIELTPEQYHEYVVSAGKPAKMILDQLVNQPSWDQRPKQQKIDIIEQVIHDQRRTARDQLLIKYPDLIEEYVDKSLEEAEL